MTRLLCPDCGRSSDAGATSFACPCGGLLDVEHDLGPVDRGLFDERAGALETPDSSGVWRFRELVHPTLAAAAIVSLHEGATPLYASPAVAAWVGARALRVKHEGMNPTGSFKDRGMTVAISQAKASGATRVVCASTGNTAASLAAYAAAASLRAVVLAPEGRTALGKLSQALAYGARTLLLRGDFDDGMRIVREHADELGLYPLNSLNPFRVEGQKTIVLETLQQLRWAPPDWIVFPAGNLGNCAAFGKALREAVALGLVERAPRLAAIQARGANPFERAYRAGFDALEPMAAETIATAIRIGHPVSYRRAVRAIRETNGVVDAVSDDELLEAKAVVDGAGLGAEPASCASVAGARKLVRAGTIAAHESVVCVLTGHVLKDAETTLAYHRGELGKGERANPPRVIDADVDALRAALD